MDEQSEKRNKLALDVLRLSRNTLLVNLRFLDAALNQLEPLAVEGLTLATDGEALAYDPAHVLRMYRDEREAVTRAYLHMVLHGVFRHMFVHTLVDHHIWDLSCDIAVEYVIAGLGLKAATTRRELLQRSIYAELQKEIRQFTAEKIYRYYLDRQLPPEKLAELRGAFYNDDHRLWYMTEAERALALGRPVSVSVSVEPGEGDGDGEGEGIAVAYSSEPGEGEGNSLPVGVSAAEARWSEISRRMQMDMETFSKLQGDRAGNLMQNLREVNREKYDYTAFLKKFAVRGEAMRINDEEFDYVYYTYGLKLYKKMPLVEPLEYKEVKRIREFVIAIDTSGSVAGEQVQSFLQKTYNILKSTESFFSRINVHILQCDATIQEDAKITSQEEFDAYLKSMTIRGLGGTDFRPVFSYVEWLREKKEFQNLKGLIYFTDGFGTFPAKKPDFETAFVFVDDGMNNYDVPPWAIKLVLQKEEI